MTKLLLMSKGLEGKELQERCLALLRHDPQDARVLLIPTAMECQQADDFRVARLRKCYKQLTDIGIKIGHILELDTKSLPNGNEVKGVDMVYVCGGYTYYLLQRLRKIHFDKVIAELVNSGALYVSYSAGSILPGPDITVASLREKNNFGLRNTVGLKLTKLTIFPHYTTSWEPSVREFEMENGVEVTRLTDQQAILEVDGKAELIRTEAHLGAEAV